MGLKSYQVCKQGQEVPNFKLGANKYFHSLHNQKTIVLFCSSSCPHCMEEWPAIESWKKEHPNYEIIAISLDTDKFLSEEAIKKIPQDITFLCDFKG